VNSYQSSVIGGQFSANVADARLITNYSVTDYSMQKDLPGAD
jgi:hypothetical protein